MLSKGSGTLETSSDYGMLQKPLRACLLGAHATHIALFCPQVTVTGPRDSMGNPGYAALLFSWIGLGVCGLTCLWTGLAPAQSRGLLALERICDLGPV